MNYLLALLATATIFCACKKKNDADTFCIDGVVRFGGDPAADGFGWVIYSGDSTTTKPYIPQNLADEFKVENLKVATCLYETDEKAPCRCAVPPNKFRITSIKRR